MRDYIDAAEPFEHGVDNGFTALGRRDVRTDEPFFGKVIGTRTCRRKDVRAGLAKVRDNGFTDSFGPACDKRPKALKFECGAYQ
ncbi:hypothetical protein HDG41_004693 [Paraburkholderia sp. JPY162]|uniref:Uncharacterized protein n=1 Tax=Paraburkholderia youngii TaxID=2782701 RepID=A0A7W8L8V1_9BURK|nr:hypothetical protein [Paraburkholderia youngii]